MKKTTICLTLAMVFLLCACGSNNNGTAGQKAEKSLYAQGLDIISLMGEMVQSDSYFASYSSTPALKDCMEGISRAISEGQYDKPSAVYCLSLREEGIAEMFRKAGTDPSGDMSDRLKAYMQSKIFGSCASLLNSSAGTEALAASSIYTCTTSFVCSEASENVIYLYTYENANPVLISFIVGEGHAVYASGTYILSENIDMADMASSANDVLGVSLFQAELLEID